MPPIKVHIDDPITPNKAQEARHASDQDSPYPAAQPGVAAVPVATPQAQPQPTRTTAVTNHGPPPPQPGAVPVPPSQNAPMTALSTLPPPPRAGEAGEQQSASMTTMPPQMGIPAPQQNSTPTRGTMYSPPETTRAAPTTINFGAVPAPTATQAGSHPPGYRQDLNAQEMSSAQRASLDASERREGPGQGFGMSMGGGDASNDTMASAWNAVRGWASAAGNTLAETEKEVWKRINKD